MRGGAGRDRGGGIMKGGVKGKERERGRVWI